MKIKIASVLVANQDNALHFYTTVLGFVKQTDISMGQFRWLTVSSPEGADGVELVLDPMGFPPARIYQKALFDAGIPATAFITNDIDGEFRRLKERGVLFRGEPKKWDQSPACCLRTPVAILSIWSSQPLEKRARKTGGVSH
jgi:catechol 2,3-dioxygenase-like lactoylglutathione lyase family enzyme